jgi:hypothetical protein
MAKDAPAAPEPIRGKCLCGRFQFEILGPIGEVMLCHCDLHKRQPNIICRPSQSKERIEWQADFYASCLLMPRKLVIQGWQDHFGNLRPFVSDWERSCWSSPGLLVNGKPVTERNAHLLADSDFREIAKEFAHRFQVSVQAMRIRLEKLGLLIRAEPRQRSSYSCVQASFF